MAKGALGKGLSAIIPEENMNQIDQAYIPTLQIENIVPNPYQPRMEMEEKALAELASSIKEHGVIEPLIVTKSDKDKKFILIAGERRWRAAKLAGKKTIPVVVKDSSPQQMLELAVVENIQRADLNPLEEGMAFEQLIKQFNMSHAEISDKVGISRSAIANKIRLLQLPEEVRKGLLTKDIDEGHARALLGLVNPEVLMQAYKIVIRDHLSVRAVEELVRRLNQGHKKPKAKHERILDQKTLVIETQIKNKFTPKATLSRSLRGGKIVIPFKDDKELDDIYSKLIS